MNRWLSPALAILVAVLGVTALAQHQQLVKQTAALEQARQDLAALSARQKVDLSEVEKMQRQAAALTSESRQLREKLTTENAFATPAASATPKPAKEESPLLKMMKDPKMRAVIASQQRLAMPMLYGDLVKELNLSPADANQLYELLAAQQTKMMGAAFDDPKGLSGAAKPDESALRTLLGDEGFTKFEGYQKTMGERFTLNQFKQGLTGADTLQDAQQQGLMQIMNEEQGALKSSALSANNNAPLSEKMAALNSPEALDDHFAQQRAANARIDARAAPLLTPTQLDSLRKFQDQQIQMQRMGLELSQKMFSPKEGATGP